MWDYVRDLPDAEKFEVSVINPSLIFGPILTAAKFLVGDMFAGMLYGTMP